MQNMFTGELHARIVIDTYHEEARRHDLLKLARAGQPRRIPGVMLLERVGTARDRLLAAARQEHVAATQPSCQPCVAC